MDTEAASSLMYSSSAFVTFLCFEGLIHDVPEAEPNEASQAQ